MGDYLSNRAKQIQPSATLAVTDLARKLKSEGKDIISLSAGEPDFDTPDTVKQSATQAIAEGFTKYTAVDGIPPLKEAIVAKLKSDNNLAYEMAQILVTSGAKQAIYNAAMAVLNPGDEALIPVPYWVSYPPIAELAGATPVYIEPDASLKITPEKLEAAITSKSRLLILNSPSNPSGVAYSKEELTALGAVLRQHPQIVILTDDIYEYILWGQPTFTNIVNATPELMDRTIVINGVSKAYAMTGWRCGYAAGPTEIIKGMKKIQSQVTSCASSITQAASVTAMKLKRSDIQNMITAYKKRHDLVYNALTAMNGVECIPADGTFYLFPNVSGAMKKLGFATDVDFATHLLEKANVAVVPGSPFGAPGHIRLSYATSEKNLNTALERLTDVFGA